MRGGDLGRDMTTLLELAAQLGAGSYTPAIGDLLAKFGLAPAHLSQELALLAPACGKGFQWPSLWRPNLRNAALTRVGNEEACPVRHHRLPELE